MSGPYERLTLGDLGRMLDGLFVVEQKSCSSHAACTCPPSAAALAMVRAAAEPVSPPAPAIPEHLRPVRGIVSLVTETPEQRERRENFQRAMDEHVRAVLYAEAEHADRYLRAAMAWFAKATGTADPLDTQTTDG